jgi:hypothetical protein
MVFGVQKSTWAHYNAKVFCCQEVPNATLLGAFVAPVFR